MRKIFLPLLLLGLVALVATLAWRAQSRPDGEGTPVDVPTRPDRPQPGEPPRPSEPRVVSGPAEPAPQPVPTTQTPHGPHVRGSVRTRGGAALHGAEITLALALEGQRRTLGTAHTDAQGQWTLALGEAATLAPHEQNQARLEVSARASGHIAQTIPLRLRPAAGEAPWGVLDFALFPGRTLRGRVVDALGAGVGGAEVRLLVDGTRGERAVQAEVEVVTAQASGAFELGFTSSGSYAIAARAENVGCAWRALELAAEADPLLEDLVLVGPGFLEGQASFPDGHGAADLELWAVPEAIGMQPNALAQCVARHAEHERGTGLFHTRTRTDAQGRFRLAGLQEGRYALRVPGDEVVFEPRSGFYHSGTSGIALSIESFRLRVRAVDESGAALRGVRARLIELNPLGDGSYQSGREWNASTGGALACATFEVQSETTYALELSAPGYAKTEQLVILAQTEWEQVQELRLLPAAAPARVRLALTTDVGPLARLQAQVLSALSYTPDASLGLLEADEQGWLPPLPPGSYLFDVGFADDPSQPCWSFPARTPQPVELAAGAQREVFLATHAGGRVEVALRIAGPEPAGFAFAPAPGLSAEARALAAERHRSERGAFVTLEPLDPDPTGARTPRRIQFRAEDGALHTQVLPGARARGFELLEPGRWRVATEAQGFFPARAEITVVAGAYALAELELRAR